MDLYETWYVGISNYDNFFEGHSKVTQGHLKVKLVKLVGFISKLVCGHIKPTTPSLSSNPTTYLKTVTDLPVTNRLSNTIAK